MGEFVVIKILLKLQELRKKKHDNMNSDTEYIFIKINYSFLQFTLNYVNKNNV